jgi:mRNA-degrading endonuclease YafQ of YafQ-DinJ toxin-antitoxin module
MRVYQKLQKSLCSNHSGRNQFSPRPQSNISSFESAELDRFGKSLEKITTELDEISQVKEISLKKITQIKKILAKNPLEESSSDHKLLIKLAELKLTVKALKTRLDTAESNIHQTEPDHINIIETYTSETLLESSEKPQFCSCIIS